MAKETQELLGVLGQHKRKARNDAQAAHARIIGELDALRSTAHALLRHVDAADDIEENAAVRGRMGQLESILRSVGRLSDELEAKSKELVKAVRDLDEVDAAWRVDAEAAGYEV